MTGRPYTKPYLWELDHVHSTHIPHPVSIIVARNVPYVPNANRLQNLTIYLLDTAKTRALVGKPVVNLGSPGSSTLDTHVHIHGGAWRDPFLSSRSIEAEVAHAFSAEETPIATIVSMNYTLSPFPAHPIAPYNIAAGDSGDLAREAQHPMHIRDIMNGFALLREFGLKDMSYILSGHSCGAFLAFQAALFPPEHWYFYQGRIPTPAALLGMNALLDLPGLVHDLDDSHKQLSPVYQDLQDIAFGDDQSKWPMASPAHVDVKDLQSRVAAAEAPNVVVLDQSLQDQLVPVNQTEKMQLHLSKVEGLKVTRSHRCIGAHAAPWEEGYMIWDCVKDIVDMLQS